MLRVLFIDRQRDELQHRMETWQDCRYEACFAPDFAKGIELILSFGPNMIVTEYALRDGTIRDFADRIARISDAPLVVLSARNDEEAALAALKCGADDFIRKRDCCGPELLIRLLKLLQRHPDLSVEEEPDCVHIGQEILLDKGRHEVSRDGERVPLQRMEYRLLLALLEQRNRVVSKESLLGSLFSGPNATRSQQRGRLLYTYLSGLRRKLSLVPPADVYIKAVYGEGYCLVETSGQLV